MKKEKQISLIPIFRGILFILGILFSNVILSQVLDIKKSFDISKKTKKSALLDVQFDKTNSMYNLYYVSKLNKKIAKFEIYSFDKDFNFLKLTKDSLEFEQGRNKYKWWKFKGEEYTYEGVTIDDKDDLTARKILYEMKYSWFWDGYKVNKKVLNKEKIKDDQGEPYFHIMYYIDDNEGIAYELCGSYNDKEKYNEFKEMNLLKIDKNLKVITKTPLKFDYPQHLVIMIYNLDANDNLESLCYIFAPKDAGKRSDPDNKNYSVVITDRNLKITDRISFKSPSSYWDIYDSFLDTITNEYYFSGPSISEKNDYFEQYIGKEKFDSWQLMKINNHNTEYLTSTSLAEFGTKLKVPPSQISTSEFQGKKFFTTDHIITGDNGLVIAGQNYGYDAMAKMKGETVIKYRDAIAFYFDNKGRLVNQFSVDLGWSAYEPCKQYLFAGNSKINIYWLLLETASILGGYSSSYFGKIDTKNGTISDFTNIMKGKDKESNFELDYYFPFLDSDSNNKIVFFGTQNKGKTLFFARYILD